MPVADTGQATCKVIAQTAWGEARGERSAGMQAVINVIMNRVARQKSYFGLTPVAVCLKSCQFSAWNKGDSNREKMLAVNDNDPQFAEALKLAGLAVAGVLPDLTYGATHYFALGIDEPAWAKTMTFTVQIGHHRFFKAAA